MPRLKNLKNKQFGYWKVINKGPTIKGHTHWYCRCVCGKEVLVKSESLVSGRSKSCGCSKIKLRFKTMGISKIQGAFNRHYSNYKKGARQRGLEFNITKDDFIRISQMKCNYCGIEPKQEAKSKYGGESFFYNGLDRIDNGKGYTKENCVASCFPCNRAKQSMSLKDFKEWIKRLYEYLYN